MIDLKHFFKSVEIDKCEAKKKSGRRFIWESSYVQITLYISGIFFPNSFV